MSNLPPCGVYRTVSPIAGVEANRFVYFHNHGNPGPGIYLPESWTNNRAHFAANGITLPPGFDPRALKPLPAEGFYRVSAAFFCCEKKCVQFEPEALVQLGYNGAGRALVFIPELGAGGISIPERGNAVDDGALSNLVLLKLPERREDITLPRGMIVH